MDVYKRLVEILEYRPDYIRIKMLPVELEIKVSRQFFQKRVKSGFFEVVNEDKLPSVI